MSEIKKNRYRIEHMEKNAGIYIRPERSRIKRS